jgi:hypothetical protein
VLKAHCISVYFGKLNDKTDKLPHGYGLLYAHTLHNGYFEYDIYHGLFQHGWFAQGQILKCIRGVNLTYWEGVYNANMALSMGIETN